MDNSNLPPEQDFSDLGAGALENLYAAHQCHTPSEKSDLLIQVIEKINGPQLSTHTLKELEWYVLDMWGFNE